MIGKITKLEAPANKDAIKLLEATILRVKSGEISQIALAWVTSDNSIGGDTSSGSNNIMMWASLEHNARHCYKTLVLEE